MILQREVLEPYLPKYRSPTLQINILQKVGDPAPKMGVQDCKSAVSESSESIVHI